MRGVLGKGLLIAALLAAPATADTLRPDDAARLDRLDSAVGSGLRQALAGGEPGDFPALTTALRGTPQPAQPEALLGDWSCRTIKLGGPAPLVAYSPFRCRVTQVEGGVLLEKLTGSQRVRGRITADGDRLVLAGVAYIAGDTPPEYGALPATVDPQATPQILPAPGLVEVTGKDRARILFPFPMVESTLDILELTR